VTPSIWVQWRLKCGHNRTSSDLPQSCIPFEMPNLLVSNQDIASVPYKCIFSYTLESRRHGTYIPILYDLNCLMVTPLR
jgi:hypothetical protein